jgi:hypothetical protein
LRPSSDRRATVAVRLGGGERVSRRGGRRVCRCGRARRARCSRRCCGV